MVVGRLPGTTLAVDDPEVSGTHLILRWLAPEDGGAPCWQARPRPPSRPPSGRQGSAARLRSPAKTSELVGSSDCCGALCCRWRMRVASTAPC